MCCRNYIGIILASTGSPERPANRLIHPEFSYTAFYFEHNRISKILRLDQSKSAKSVVGKSRPPEDEHGGLDGRGRGRTSTDTCGRRPHGPPDNGVWSAVAGTSRAGHQRVNI